MTPPKSNKKARQSKPADPDVAYLDVFSARDVENWARNGLALQQCASCFYFDLEHKRATHHDALIDSLRSVPSAQINIDGWVRITDYCWSLSPLSPVGSVATIGGRFNIGREVTLAKNQAFPALYIASDRDTAERERFGSPLKSNRQALSTAELELRHPISFTTFLLTGTVEHLFDVRRIKHLKQFASIIASFQLDKKTIDTFKKFRQTPSSLIRTPAELKRWLLAPHYAWRQAPRVFGVPSVSQLFGRFVKEAGFEGIVYPSQRGGDTCIALFPRNFANSNSVVRINEPYPAGATHTVLDRLHF